MAQRLRPSKALRQAAKAAAQGVHISKEQAWQLAEQEKRFEERRKEKLAALRPPKPKQ